MKNSMIEKKLIEFIHENSLFPQSLYWVPLTRLKRKIPVIAYDLDAIYKNNDIGLLDDMFEQCGIGNVNTFQMDHLEYFEGDSIHELIYERDEDGYTFPWYVETFYFDCTEEWMVYVSHECTISFTGKKLVQISKQIFTGKYELPFEVF